MRRYAVRMNALKFCMAWLVLAGPTWLYGKTLDLSGYTDTSGAITVVRQGDSVDPYFALQALLLAQEAGLDMNGLDVNLAHWLAVRFQADGQFNRYCRSSVGWSTCQPTDADDAVLALWLRFVERLHAAHLTSIVEPPLLARANRELVQLRQTRSGIYNIAWHMKHALFMDNLEVWSQRPSEALARSIQNVFWDKSRQRYKVSTQPGHRERESDFYPSITAQIYPLWVSFPLVPGGTNAHYKRWMGQHRALWLAQMRNDYPWGLIALIAHRQGDTNSVRCWQAGLQKHRQASRWTVTDEVISQILPPLTDTPPLPEECQ